MTNKLPQVSVKKDPFGSVVLTAEFARECVETLERWTPLIDKCMDEIAKKFAEIYLAEHYQEMVAKIDPQAVANMAVVSMAVALQGDMHAAVVTFKNDAVKKMLTDMVKGLFASPTKDKEEGD